MSRTVSIIIMGPRDFMTVGVLNLSPRATLAALTSFFSYCGTVHQIQLLSEKDQLPYAFVTFGQPYAFQTALLLDNAIFDGQPICILPASDIKIPVVSDEGIDHTQGKRQWVTPAATNMKRKGKGNLENLKLWEKARADRGTNNISNLCRRTGSRAHGHCHYESDVLGKASRSASELGIRRKG